MDNAIDHAQDKLLQIKKIRGERKADYRDLKLRIADRQSGLVLFLVTISAGLILLSDKPSSLITISNILLGACVLLGIVFCIVLVEYDSIKSHQNEEDELDYYNKMENLYEAFLNSPSVESHTKLREGFLDIEKKVKKLPMKVNNRKLNIIYYTLISALTVSIGFSLISNIYESSTKNTNSKPYWRNRHAIDDKSTLFVPYPDRHRAF